MGPSGPDGIRHESVSAAETGEWRLSGISSKFPALSPPGLACLRARDESANRHSSWGMTGEGPGAFPGSAQLPPGRPLGRSYGEGTTRLQSLPGSGDSRQNKEHFFRCPRLLQGATASISRRLPSPSAGHSGWRREGEPWAASRRSS